MLIDMSVTSTFTQSTAFLLHSQLYRVWQMFVCAQLEAVAHIWKRCITDECPG